MLDKTHSKELTKKNNLYLLLLIKPYIVYITKNETNIRDGYVDFGRQWARDVNRGE